MIENRVTTSLGQKSRKFDQKKRKIAETKVEKAESCFLENFFLSSQKWSFCNTEMTVLELSVHEFTKWICHWRQHFFDTGLWKFMRIVWNQKNLNPVFTAIWEVIYFIFHIHVEDDSCLARKIKGLPEKHALSKIMLVFHKTKRKISFLTYSDRVWLRFHLLY